MLEKKRGNSSKEKINLAELKKVLDSAEKQIRIAKQLLFNEMYKQKSASLGGKNACSNVIAGVFDGINMIDCDGKKYAIPSNYASKSKLVPGDVLKLTVDDFGDYTYKQTAPVIRKRLSGYLVEDDGDYSVDCDGKLFNVLAASVTYYKAKGGNKVTLLVAKDSESNWGAIDNVFTESGEK